MRRPTDDYIYTPHHQKTPINVPEPIIRMADSESMLVSFEEDGVSNPKHRQAYFLVEPGQKVWGGWYVIAGWECLEETTTSKEKVKNG
jgi:hypothetical protein